jgi:hypothetical protein
LTLKWRPVSGGRYHSGILGTEFINRNMGQEGGSAENDNGGNIWAQYQFAERWSANIRFDDLEVKNSIAVPADAANTPLPNGSAQRYTTGVTFTATEFSAYRLEYSEQHGLTNLANFGNDQRIYVQANYTIGSHPAHSY